MMTKDTGNVGLHKKFIGLSGIYYFCAGQWLDVDG
jgi:hypothetical protein